MTVRSALSPRWPPLRPDTPEDKWILTESLSTLVMARGPAWARGRRKFEGRLDRTLGRSAVVDYCLRVTPGESVLIGSEWAAPPLVEACYKAVVLREAFPLIRLDFPGLSEFFLNHATNAQLAPRALGRPL